MFVCVLFGGVAMLFKENGATVFGVCLAYDLFIHSHKLLWRYIDIDNMCVAQYPLV